jgi:hypothetical protein
LNFRLARDYYRSNLEDMSQVEVSRQTTNIMINTVRTERSETYITFIVYWFLILQGLADNVPIFARKGYYRRVTEIGRETISMPTVTRLFREQHSEQ